MKVRLFEFGMWGALIFILAQMIVTYAWALDFSQEIKDQNGTTIQTGGKPLTLGAAVGQALFANLPGDEKLSGEEKFNRGKLALKIGDGGDIGVSVEEITQMKKVVAAAYSPLLVTRIWMLLDPSLEVKAVKTEPVEAPPAEAPKE